MNPARETPTPTPFTVNLAPDVALLHFGAYRLEVHSEGVAGWFVACYDAAEIATMAPGDDWPAALQYFALPPRRDLPTIGAAPRVD